MAYERIENYGVIGNMRTVALVSLGGSIDWLCFPHFDSPSVFAALLDDEKGGRFSIHPVRRLTSPASSSTGRTRTSSSLASCRATAWRSSKTSCPAATSARPSGETSSFAA